MHASHRPAVLPVTCARGQAGISLPLAWLAFAGTEWSHAPGSRCGSCDGSAGEATGRCLAGQDGSGQAGRCMKDASNLAGDGMPCPWHCPCRRTVVQTPIASCCKGKGKGKGTMHLSLKGGVKSAPERPCMHGQAISCKLKPSLESPRINKSRACLFGCFLPCRLSLTLGDSTSAFLSLISFPACAALLLRDKPGNVNR